MSIADVAIIGAGPYGLSIAAYLRDRGLDVLTFGRPMDTWLKHMPRGMRLKSEGFASNICDPGGELTLAHFCRESGIGYADHILPVALDTFCEYGLAFQRRFLSDLDQRDVARVVRSDEGFELELDDGERVRARRTIVAAGISHYGYLPPALTGMPEEALVHSSRYRDYDRFRGKTVAVIGAGASAIDVALSLHDAGASPQLVARTTKLAFHDPPQAKRSLLSSLLYPRSGLGCGLRSRLASDAPHLFARLPRAVRSYALRSHLGPAPCWFTKEEFERNVATHLGAAPERCEVRDGRVVLNLISAAGTRTQLVADSVVAATGYKVDLDRLAFLDPGLRAGIRRYDGAPVLSQSFESSIRGLYFVGLSAATTFGPLLRFAFGAKFAAERLRAHLAGPKRAGYG